MILTISMCSWCASPRPISVEGADWLKVPPGLHTVQMQVSHGMCPICEAKFATRSGEGGVTQSDTAPRDHQGEERKGS